MFLPLSVEPQNLERPAWANRGLILVNLLVYLFITLPASFSTSIDAWPAARLRDLVQNQGFPDALVRHIANGWDAWVLAFGYKPGLPHTLDLVFSLFMHSGLVHLAGNMLFLGIYGGEIERRLKPLRYLALYLVSGVLASWAFAALSGGGFTPLIGASGAISGVLGLFFMLCPKHRVRAFVFLFPFVMGIYAIPARWVLGFYILMDNLLPAMVGGQSSGVAYGAHLGGFFFGLAAGAWLRRHAQLADPSTEAAPSWNAAPHSEAAPGWGAAAASGPTQAAQVNLMSLDTAEMLIEDGELEDAARLLMMLRKAERPEVDRAKLAYLLGLTRLLQDAPTRARQHLLDVFDFNPSPELVQKTHRLLRACDADRL